MSASSSCSKLSYKLNKHLDQDCPAPPVSLGRAWAEAYPSEQSPYKTSTHEAQQSVPGLLNLAQGVPGHLPSSGLLERVKLELGKDCMAAASYGPVFGAPELRAALAEDMNQRYAVQAEQCRINVQNVAITAGANMAAAVAFQAVAGPGDAVVLPTPWYFNHQMTLASLGVDVIALPTSAPSFEPDPSSFSTLLKDEATSKRIKALVLVTPNNPTGAIYSEEVLHRFADLCKDSGVALILDETYRDFLLDESGAREGQEVFKRPHSLFSRPDWQATIIHIYSFSKSYAIPGWRLGALVAHEALLAGAISSQSFGPVAKALDNYQICPARIDAQRAVAWAIHDSNEKTWRLQNAKLLLARRTAFLELMTAVEKSGWKVECTGAYYAYVSHPWARVSSETVAKELAQRVGVVVLPGAFFTPAQSRESAAQRLRFSIANVCIDRLQELPARLELISQMELA
ncbi:PLP-dependent transferase [Ceraceosorus guamensis]|uniref:PLP-dependent transferase n=1 Tax=Ceraceosorus guamensis TaxID=1522189 RepID=A0A316W5Z8_9BASI|nr:PLP-dependent transferase [Ceraceosorus guamensis]PWN45299.1 PLP-dependent transferase [Ceraceosorus guamensis]